MSFSKVLCVAVAGCVLCSGVAMARPDTTTQPPAKAGHGKAHHKNHKGSKHHRKHTKAPSNPQ